MRVRNKELRARRHRKEQKIKEATKALLAQFGDGKSADKAAKKPAAAAKKPAAKKAAPKKDASAE